MRRLESWVGLTAVLFVAQPLTAQGFGLTPSAGTLGFGVQAAVSFNTQTSIRAGAHWQPLEVRPSFSGIDFTVQLPSPTFTAMLDWYPGGGPFRLSGGAVAFSDEMAIVGELTESVDLGGVSYAPADVGTLRGSLALKSWAPYLGVGFGNPARSAGFGFFLDLGVAFSGSPAVALSADGPLAGEALFQENLERERRDIESDVEPYKYYPVASLGFSVRVR